MHQQGDFFENLGSTDSTAPANGVANISRFLKRANLRVVVCAPQEPCGNPQLWPRGDALARDEAGAGRLRNARRGKAPATWSRRWRRSPQPVDAAIEALTAVYDEPRRDPQRTHLSLRLNIEAHLMGFQRACGCPVDSSSEHQRSIFMISSRIPKLSRCTIPSMISSASLRYLGSFSRCRYAARTVCVREYPDG